MRKLFYLMIFIFPITTSFSLISTNIWWKETKNLGLLLKPQSIMTNNKWGLNRVVRKKLRFYKKYK